MRYINVRYLLTYLLTPSAVSGTRPRQKTPFGSLRLLQNASDEEEIQKIIQYFDHTEIILKILEVSISGVGPVNPFIIIKALQRSLVSSWSLRRLFHRR